MRRPSSTTALRYGSDPTVEDVMSFTLEYLSRTSFCTFAQAPGDLKSQYVTPAANVAVVSLPAIL